jgi:hypothetical protein
MSKSQRPITRIRQKEDGMPRLSFQVLCLVLAVWILVSPNAYADSAEQMEKQLAGAQAREWVLKAFTSYLGPGDKCKSGESYRFKVDHTVTVSRCIKGEIHDETQTWSIETDQLETRLTLGSTHYILKFSDKGKAHFMTLRKKATIKTEKTEDMTFRLAED